MESVAAAYTTKVTVGNTTQTVISGLADGTTYYFAATAYDNSGIESPLSNEAYYSVPNNAAVTPINNKRPTLGRIANRSLNENAGTQHIKLTGISSGSSTEHQPLTITAATPSNPDLIPDLAASVMPARTIPVTWHSPRHRTLTEMPKSRSLVTDGQTVSQPGQPDFM